MPDPEQKKLSILNVAVGRDNRGQDVLKNITGSDLRVHKVLTGGHMGETVLAEYVGEDPIFQQQCCTMLYDEENKKERWWTVIKTSLIANNSEFTREAKHVSDMANKWPKLPVVLGSRSTAIFNENGLEKSVEAIVSPVLVFSKTPNGEPKTANAETYVKELRQSLAKKSPQEATFKPVMDIFKNIYEGLDSAHSANIMHYDISLRNFFLFSQQNEISAKLGDWGKSQEMKKMKTGELNLSDLENSDLESVDLEKIIFTENVSFAKNVPLNWMSPNYMRNLYIWDTAIEIIRAAQIDLKKDKDYPKFLGVIKEAETYLKSQIPLTPMDDLFSYRAAVLEALCPKGLHEIVNDFNYKNSTDDIMALGKKHSPQEIFKHYIDNLNPLLSKPEEIRFLNCFEPFLTRDFSTYRQQENESEQEMIERMRNEDKEALNKVCDNYYFGEILVANIDKLKAEDCSPEEKAQILGELEHIVVDTKNLTQKNQSAYEIFINLLTEPKDKLTHISFLEEYIKNLNSRKSISPIDTLTKAERTIEENLPKDKDELATMNDLLSQRISLLEIFSVKRPPQVIDNFTKRGNPQEIVTLALKLEKHLDILQLHLNTPEEVRFFNCFYPYICNDFYRVPSAKDIPAEPITSLMKKKDKEAFSKACDNYSFVELLVKNIEKLTNEELTEEKSLEMIKDLKQAISTVENLTEENQFAYQLYENLLTASKVDSTYLSLLKEHVNNLNNQKPTNFSNQVIKLYQTMSREVKKNKDKFSTANDLFSYRTAFLKIFNASELPPEMTRVTEQAEKIQKYVNDHLKLSLNTPEKIRLFNCFSSFIYNDFSSTLVNNDEVIKKTVRNIREEDAKIFLKAGENYLFGELLIKNIQKLKHPEILKEQYSQMLSELKKAVPWSQDLTQKNQYAYNAYLSLLKDPTDRAASAQILLLKEHIKNLNTLDETAFVMVKKSSIATKLPESEEQLSKQEESISGEIISQNDGLNLTKREAKSSKYLDMGSFEENISSEYVELLESEGYVNAAFSETALETRENKEKEYADVVLSSNSKPEEITLDMNEEQSIHYSDVTLGKIENETKELANPRPQKIEAQFSKYRDMGYVEENISSEHVELLESEGYVNVAFSETALETRETKEKEYADVILSSNSKPELDLYEEQSTPYSDVTIGKIEKETKELENQCPQKVEEFKSRLNVLKGSDENNYEEENEGQSMEDRHL